MNNKKGIKMDSNNGLIPAFGRPYKLDPISEIIIYTQKNQKKIKREYKKLKKFFQENPEAYYYTLESSKEKLESKEDLTEFDEKSLREIKDMLSDNRPVEKIFSFNETFLVDTYQKIYQQLKHSDLKKLPAVVEVVFYSLSERAEAEKKTIVGEFYPDGSLNTGSQLQIEIMKLNPLLYISLYSSLMN